MMATTKPRITVTLEPEDYEVLRTLSEMNGESMSSIVAGLTAATRPVLTKVIEAGRAFEALSAARQDDARELISGANATIEPQLERLQADVLSLMGDFDGALADLADPRPVTRGSRPPTSHPTAHETGRPSPEADT